MDHMHRINMFQEGRGAPITCFMTTNEQCKLASFEIVRPLEEVSLQLEMVKKEW